MVIKTRVMPNMTILDLAGELTYANRAVFKAAVERVRQAGCRHLVLNMEQVRFVDSAALGILALYCQTFRLNRTVMSLLRPQSYIREIITLANMHHMLTLYESEDDAIAGSSTALLS